MLVLTMIDRSVTELAIMLAPTTTTMTSPTGRSRTD
jgi:hypothetical protein